MVEINLAKYKVKEKTYTIEVYSTVDDDDCNMSIPHSTYETAKAHFNDILQTFKDYLMLDDIELDFSGKDSVSYDDMRGDCFEIKIVESNLYE